MGYHLRRYFVGWPRVGTKIHCRYFARYKRFNYRVESGTRLEVPKGKGTPIRLVMSREMVGVIERTHVPTSCHRISAIRRMKDAAVLSHMEFAWRADILKRPATCPVDFGNMTDTEGQ